MGTRRVVMTTLEKLTRANRWRIKTGKMASDESAGWNGCFLVPLEGHMWHVQISDGQGWRHLSISNAQSRTLPSWTVMCRVKESFYDDAEWVVQFHPPKAEYINDHPYCLHLWSPLDEKLPVPHYTLV